MYDDSSVSFDFLTIMKCSKSMVTDSRVCFRTPVYSSVEAPTGLEKLIQKRAICLIHSRIYYVQEFKKWDVFLLGKIS